MGCYNFSMRANTWSIKMEDFFVVWLACQFSMSLSQSPQTIVFSCSCECPFCSLWMLLLLFLARLSPSQFGRGMSLGWDQCAQMGSNSLSAGIVAKVAQNSWTISRIGGGNAPKISKEGKDSYPSSKNKKDKKKKGGGNSSRIVGHSTPHQSSSEWRHFREVLMYRRINRLGGTPLKGSECENS